MSTIPHDWDVTIDCPECGQHGRVTVSSMKAVLHCPACRARIVVGRDGVKKAGRDVILAGQAALLTAQSASPSVPAARSERSSGAKQAPRSPFRAEIATGLGLAVLILTLASLALLWSRPSSADPFDLHGQASAFGRALLVDDLDAGAKAATVEARELGPWWRARRAALTAGFGKHARGELGSLEIEEHGSTAVVRLPVVIQGREQVFFQDWERSSAGWRLQVGSTASSAGGRRP